MAVSTTARITGPPPKEEETVNGCLAETAKGHLKKLRAALALQLEKPSCNISVQMLKLCGSLKPQILVS